MHRTTTDTDVWTTLNCTTGTLMELTVYSSNWEIFKAKNTSRAHISWAQYNRKTKKGREYRQR